MRIQKTLLLIVLGMLANPWTMLYGQLPVQFSLAYDGKPLELGAENVGEEGETVTIERLRFYIGGVSLWKGNEEVWGEEMTYRLLDAEHPASLSFVLDTPSDLEFTTLQFSLGIDSLTNVSGVFGGDLDPTKGMYWAWNSGYINFKLEGRSSDCPTRNHAFQFHLGGYLPPNQSLQTIRLDCPSTDTLNIRLDIAHFLQRLDLAEQHTVMSPGPDAAAFSSLAAKAFHYAKD